MLGFCRQENARKQDSQWSIVVCICATLSQALIMGIAQGFGVFLPVVMNEFNSSREHTAWIGSLGIAMTFCLSPITGRLCDRFGSRPIGIIGGIFCSLGLILTSLSKELNLFFLTYSLLFGLGTSCCRMSNFLMVSKYFKRRRSLATGIATAGAGLGVFSLSPLSQLLINKLGLSGAYRVLGFVMLTNSILALPYDPNIDEDVEVTDSNSQKPLDNQTDSPGSEGATEGSNRCRNLIDFSVWKVPVFAIAAVCAAGMSIVTFTAQFHLVRYCEDLDISATQSSKLLMIFGITSCVTRIVAGRLCDIKGVNPVYALQVGMLLNSLSVLLYGVPSTFAPFAVISVVYGIGDGMSLAVENLLLLTSVEPSRRASAFGLANTLISVTTATGAPLSGFIADQTGSYVLAFYIVGSLGILFALLPFTLLCFKQNNNNNNEGRQPLTVDS